MNTASQFLEKCIKFIEDEQRQNRKDFMKILTSKKQKQEGLSIDQAKIDSFEDGKIILKYPEQFTKIRAEQKVVFYNSMREKIVSAEVLEIDYLAHTLSIREPKKINLSIKETYLLLQDSDIFPKSVVESLAFMKESSNLNPLISNIIRRNSNIKTSTSAEIENILKTVDQMSYSFLGIHGPPGAGKTYTSRKIISHLLKKGKRILISSNSHSAINNLLNQVNDKGFTGCKISSKSKHNSDNDLIENIQVDSENIDDEISGFQIVAGTCFSLSKIQTNEFDYLIIDEASQLKLSFVLAVAKVAKNLIVMGDHLQLTSISSIPITSGGESVLDYILNGEQILPSKDGYFLNKTYRCESSIAKVVSEVFYAGKLDWEKKKVKGKIEIVYSNHNSNAKLNMVEAKDILKTYKELLKKYDPKDIIVVVPYNAQASYLRANIKSKETKVGSVDLMQGSESKAVIYGFTVSGKEESDAKFVTCKHRVNVSISRGISEVYLFMSKNLVKSKHTTPEFKKIIKMIEE